MREYKGNYHLKKCSGRAPYNYMRKVPLVSWKYCNPLATHHNRDLQ